MEDKLAPLATSDDSLQSRLLYQPRHSNVLSAAFKQDLLRTTTRRLLPMSKIAFMLDFLMDFLLLQHGDFANALIVAAEQAIKNFPENTGHALLSGRTLIAQPRATKGQAYLKVEQSLGETCSIRAPVRRQRHREAGGSAGDLDVEGRATTFREHELCTPLNGRSSSFPKCCRAVPEPSASCPYLLRSDGSTISGSVLIEHSNSDLLPFSQLPANHTRGTCPFVRALEA